MVVPHVTYNRLTDSFHDDTGCVTTLKEDIAALKERTESMESKIKAVLQYRIERKLLLRKTRDLLVLYKKGKIVG